MMLFKPLLQIICVAGVITTVCTLQHVNPKNISTFLGRLTRPSTSSGRTEFFLKTANVDKVPGNRSSSGHGRADQMRATAIALASFEITIGRGGAVLT